MSSKSLLAFAFLAALIGAAPAHAQMEAGDWEVGFGVGGKQLDSDLVDDSETELRVEVRGGYFFTDGFESAEPGSLSVVSNTLGSEPMAHFP